MAPEMIEIAISRLSVRDSGVSPPLQLPRSTDPTPPTHTIRPNSRQHAHRHTHKKYNIIYILRKKCRGIARMPVAGRAYEMNQRKKATMKYQRYNPESGRCTRHMHQSDAPQIAIARRRARPTRLLEAGGVERFEPRGGIIRATYTRPRHRQQNLP